LKLKTRTDRAARHAVLSEVASRDTELALWRVGRQRAAVVHSGVALYTAV